MTITGQVKNIEFKGETGHAKKVVTLEPDHRQKAFVEFRGKNIKLLSDIKVNDEIVVSVLLEGRVSSKSGVQYNNLVAEELISSTKK